MYIVAKKENVKKALEEMARFFHKKNLKMSMEKTKILCKKNVKLPDDLKSLREDNHVKIGGAFVQADEIPLPATEIEKENACKTIKAIQHQHAYQIWKIVLVPRWKYLFQGTCSAILGTYGDRVKAWQEDLVYSFLKTSSSHEVKPNQDQLYAEENVGGMGLFHPVSFPTSELEANLKRTRVTTDDWKNSQIKLNGPTSSSPREATFFLHLF
jgi:hypothetical protein